MDVDVSQFKAWWKASRDQSSDWRDEAEEDYGFYAGHQWDPEDMALLEEQGRPPITFNRTGPIVDAISGMEVGNRQEIMYVPRDNSDAWLNANFNGVARWVRDEAGAEDEESESFKDMTICGVGCVETRMDYDDDPDGLIKLERADPLEMLWDPSARRQNLVDRRWDCRIKDIERETAAELFPDKDESFLNADWANDVNPKAHDAQAAPFYRNDQSENSGSETVRILHFQWFEREPVYRVEDPESGKTVFMEVDRYEEINKQIPLKGVKQSKKKYYYAFVGKEILDQGEMETGFTREFMTAKRDRNEDTWYGIVRAMKDPQRWANKWLSQTLYIINSNAKGGLLAEKTAFDNPRQAEESWADPDAITWLREGGLQKIETKPDVKFPSGMDKLMEFAVSSIRDTTGVNLELLGMANRQQAGVVEQHRKQSGVTILAELFDSLRRYRKNQSRLLIDFIQKFIPDQRIVRILGENGNPEFVPFMKSDESQTFDIVIDDAPHSPNQKERTWGAVMEMLPLLQNQIPPKAWPELLKSSPLPTALVAKITEAIQQHKPAPDPKVELEKAKFEMEQQSRAAELEMEQQKLQMQVQGDQQKAQGQLDIERMKSQGQLALQTEEMRQKMALKAEELEHQMGLDEREANHEARLAAIKAQADIEVARYSAEQHEEANRKPMVEVGEMVKKSQEQTEAKVERNENSISRLSDVVSDLAEKVNSPSEVIYGANGRPKAIKKNGNVVQLRKSNG